MRDFKPQELANTAWAFATAGRDAPALFDAMAAEATRRVRNFKTLGLANTAWAFATAGRDDPALFAAMAAKATRRVRDFTPEGLAMTALPSQPLAVMIRRCSPRWRGRRHGARATTVLFTWP